MRIDLASYIKVNETVYNCFLEPLTIINKKVFCTDDGGIFDIVFIVQDGEDNRHEYRYEDLYLQDLLDEDDAEQSWVNWAKDNKDFFDTFDHIETIKEIYKAAFANGFQHKFSIRFDELMQK